MVFLLFCRQTWALCWKDLLIVAQRHWFSTVFRALILPLLYTLLISSIRIFFLPPSKYGFGDTKPFPPPADAFASQSGRDRVVLIHNNFTGGFIEAAIDHLSSTYRAAGADVQIASAESELQTLCRSSLTGTSRCYGAVAFWGSPGDIGSSQVWDFSAYNDWALGSKVHVDQENNDAQVFALPFVHAIDSAIANVSGKQFAADMLQYPFTSQTFQQREDKVQSQFMSALQSYLGLVVFIAVCGITYHLPGHVAREREIGISSLIDTMNPQQFQWLSFASRIIAVDTAFSLLYMPANIGIAAIIATRMFIRTSTAMLVLFHILTCFSLAGFSAFLASFFRHAQLSGISIVIFSCLLAVIAQWAVPGYTIAVAILSLFFPPINYVLFTIYVAAAEGLLKPADFSQASWTARSALPGYFYFVAALIQMVLCPLLALWVERTKYGTSNFSRGANGRHESEPHALALTNLSMTYRPSLLARCAWWKRAEIVHAVVDISFVALRGQLVALLGENGAGKTTTMAAITAQEDMTSGAIKLDQDGGLGFCPQRNVLWDELTVSEHVKIFEQLKTISGRGSKSTLRETLSACDLQDKMNVRTKILSGGQKRKVQLAMAFTGGSKVCCIDEASTGLDPVSRRKIWDILLSERGNRTLLFTTHALDEADALSDQIIILERGRVKMQGSAVELKQRYGQGYQISVDCPGQLDIRGSDTVRYERADSTHTFHTTSPPDVGDIMKFLALRGLHDFDIQGPTIEQVFISQARTELEHIPCSPKPGRMKKVRTNHSHDTAEMELLAVRPTNTTEVGVASPHLPDSRPIGFLGQVWVIFRKRLTVFPRNWIPYFFALLIPTITAGIATSFLTGFAGITCSPDDLSLIPSTAEMFDYVGHPLPIGPTGDVDADNLLNMYGLSTSAPESIQILSNTFVYESTYTEWNSFIHGQYPSIEPGGLFLGNESSPTPVMAYRIDGGMQYAAVMKAAADAYLMNTTISSRFLNFALPIGSAPGDSLQLVIYFGLAMAIIPGLFALYPSFERTRNIRQLQYSNGVRAGPVWLAHLSFDAMFVVAISTVSIIILSERGRYVWHFIPYLWPVFFFYGLSATLAAYIVSLFVSTQLGAFAFAAGYQAVSLLLCFTIYLLMVAFSVAEDLQTNLSTIQYSLGLIMPSGSLLRALLLSLNQSQLLCQEQAYRRPGTMSVFVAPILYLGIQCVAFYAFLVCYENGSLSSLSRHFSSIVSIRSSPSVRRSDVEDSQPGQDVLSEIKRVESSVGDSLRVLHVSKAFSSKRLVVDDVTFGVKSSECFALLGPNGAGKTTTINLIRGNTKLSQNASRQLGHILIGGKSLVSDRSGALRYLGVCPQFDAIDMLTVNQHLEFYARAAGIPSNAIKSITTHILHAVGLTQYSRRLAATLSGGNKRKMSLAIAVIGNPQVLLLDEPSSGLDAVSKRVMWKALEGVRHMRQGRGLAMVFTSHSMEEVAALADRVGIMKKHMLVVGEKRELSRRYGNRFHVHLKLCSPSTSSDESEMTVTESEVKGWIRANMPGAVVEREMLHGQLRFWIPRRIGVQEGIVSEGAETLAMVFRKLEMHKRRLGIEYYTVLQTDWEDVFLNVIGRQNGD